MSFDASNLVPGVTSLLQNDGIDVPIARLSSAEVIGIYFSAHWCERCRSFTPVLSKAYDALKAAGKRFEIVFVSCDRNEDIMRSYYAEMPWLCLNWADLKRIEDDLSATYECHGIPHLVLVDAGTGKLITADGRCAVSLGAHAFPFTAASVSAAKKAKARNVLGLLDSGRALGLKPHALPSDAVAIFIGNSDNSASRVVHPLSEATEALGSRIKVVCIPFRVRDPDKQLVFAAKFHPDWHVLQNSEALAAAIFDTVDADAQEALLLVCSSSFSDVIQTNACETVIQHKERGFPWSDEALAHAIEERQRQVAAFAETLHHPGLQFLNGAQIVTRPGGTPHSLDDLRLMDCVALYFSSLWCRPCKFFTPQLALVHQQLAEEGKKFGVVYVSWDRSEAEFREYFDTMPWVALAFGQRELKDLISEAFGVRGIPHVVLVDPKTGACNTNGRQVIDEYGAVGFPWVDLAAAAAAVTAAAAAQQAELEQRWCNAGKVAMKPHSGCRGLCTFSHEVEFNLFNTFVADVKLSNGRFYYEVEILSLTLRGPVQCATQFGVCTDGFEALAESRARGVGDDSFSFAVDGVNQQLWPDEGHNFGSKWENGQVIGFAIDMMLMSQAGCASMSVSVDGSFAAPNGLAFDGIPAGWLSPAFSACSGKFRMNFGDTPFRHSPPDASFVSVNDAARAERF